jgi:hypothetical protein
VTDVSDVPEVESTHHFRKIIGVRIHVVTMPRLVRAAMPAAVMSDHAEAISGKLEKLVFPSVRI